MLTILAGTVHWETPSLGSYLSPLIGMLSGQRLDTQDSPRGTYSRFFAEIVQCVVGL